MNKKHWLIPAAVAALIATGGTAVACSGYGGLDGYRSGHHRSMQHQGFRGHGHGQRLHAAYRVSDLTDAQRTQLDKVFDAAQDARYESMKRWRDGRRALREAMRSGADSATVRPLAEKAGQHMAELIVLRADARARVHAILTPAQRNELKQMAGGGRMHGPCDRTVFKPSRGQGPGPSR